MTHPYNDPFASGLVQLTPSQRLMNADLFRRRRGPAPLAGDGGHSHPMAGLGGSLDEVLSSAGHGSGQAVASDADKPTQAVHSDGENIYHTRDNGDGTSTTLNIGPDSLNQQEGDESA